MYHVLFSSCIYMSYYNAAPTQEGLCGFYFATKSKINKRAAVFLSFSGLHVSSLKSFPSFITCCSFFQAQRVLSSSTTIPIKYKLQ